MSYSALCFIQLNHPCITFNDDDMTATFPANVPVGKGRLRAIKFGTSDPASVIFEATSAPHDAWNMAKVEMTSTEEYQVWE